MERVRSKLGLNEDRKFQRKLEKQKQKAQQEQRGAAAQGATAGTGTVNSNADEKEQLKPEDDPKYWYKDRWEEKEKKLRRPPRLELSR